MSIVGTKPTNQAGLATPVERKRPADGQIDAIDPQETLDLGAIDIVGAGIVDTVLSSFIV
jgi:hypothetical protein